MRVASTKAVREALASQIQTLTGLATAPRMPDQINPPQAAIMPGLPYAKYGLTLGEAAMFTANPIPVATELNLRIIVLTSLAPGLADAQEAMDEYLGLQPSNGTMSIPQAILHDPTLGDLVDYCEPIDIVAYSSEKVAGQEYFRGMMRVTISVTQDMGA